MTTHVQTGIERDAWLSDILGRDVFRVDARESSDPLADVVRAHSECQRAALYYVKVPVTATRLLHQFGGAGFHVVDTNVVYTWDPGDAARRGETPERSSPNADVQVAPIEPHQEAAVLDIAGSCFRYTRFHIDPFVPLATAHEVKRAWVENYVRRVRGEDLLVAVRGDRPAGFLAVLAGVTGGRRTYTIDLIGVATAEQRRGVGLALTRAFIARYRDRDAVLQVGTQIANVPSIRLYEQLGFRLSDARYVMHLHVRDGKPVAAAGPRA